MTAAQGDSDLRILWVTSSFPRYAGDSTAPFLLEQARSLVAEGCSIHVLAPHAPRLQTHEVMDGVTVQRYRYMWPESGQTLFYGGGVIGGLRRNALRALLVPFAAIAMFASVFGQLRRAKRAGQPFSLVHSHWIVPQGLIAGLAARLLGVAHVSTGHGSDLSALSIAPFRWLKRRAIRLTDILHVATPQMRDLALELDARSSPAVIPLGVDLSAGLAVREQKDLGNELGKGAPIVFVGRLSPEKGADVLLDSIPFLEGDAAERPVVIIGGGAEEGPLKAQAAKLGVADRVRFVGPVPVDTARDWIRKAAVVVVPSRQEGLGIVAIEALAIGAPVVASRTGGLPDVTEGGKLATLVPVAEPRALAAAISQVFLQPDVAFAKSQMGQQRVRQRFALDMVARQIVALYREAMRKQ